MKLTITTREAAEIGAMLSAVANEFIGEEKVEVFAVPDKSRLVVHANEGKTIYVLRANDNAEAEWQKICQQCGGVEWVKEKVDIQDDDYCWNCANHKAYRHTDAMDRDDD